MTYAVSFLAGAAVMAVEIVSAQLVAAHYGQSLIVWSGVIGTTLAALAAGYLLGGRVADRWPTSRPLLIALAFAAMMTGSLPGVAAPLMSSFAGAGLRAGAVLTSIVLLLPPLAAISFVLPVLVRTATREVGQVGRRTGNLNALWTLGGIAGTFVWSLGLLPAFGAHASCWAAALTLLAAILAALAREGKWHLAPFPAAAAVLLYFIALAPVRPGTLYRSEGVHGQLIVADRENVRYLLVDGVAQTAIYTESGVSAFRYIHALGYQCAELPEGSRALLLGLGGGTLANELAALGFRVTSVEIDPRMAEVGRAYFGLNDGCEVIIDDARHYINRTRERFDVVVLDCFAGERAPAHVLSLEAFQRVRSLLTDRGMLLVNYVGFSQGERGRATRSIAETLRAAGFHVYANATGSDEQARNIILTARVQPGALPSTTRARACCKAMFETLAQNPVQLGPGDILTDDRSPLDALNVEYHERLRQAAMRYLGDLTR